MVVADATGQRHGEGNGDGGGDEGLDGSTSIGAVFLREHVVQSARVGAS